MTRVWTASKSLTTPGTVPGKSRPGDVWDSVVSTADAAAGWLILGLITVYRRWISPFKGFSCAYRVGRGRMSCSAYGQRVVRRFGLVKGRALLRRRLAACASAARIMKAKRHAAEPWALEESRNRVLDAGTPIYAADPDDRNRESVCDCIGCDLGSNSIGDSQACQTPAACSPDSASFSGADGCGSVGSCSGADACGGCSWG